MVFPCFFTDNKYLEPLREASKLIAKKRDWEPLYDQDKLKDNQVKVACIIYEQVIFFFTFVPFSYFLCFLFFSH